MTAFTFDETDRVHEAALMSRINDLIAERERLQGEQAEVENALASHKGTAWLLNTRLFSIIAQIDNVDDLIDQLQGELPEIDADMVKAHLRAILAKLPPEGDLP